MKRKQAVFIGDVFRVHTMLRGGDFWASTEKLAHLFGNTLENLGYTTTIIKGPDSPEIAAIYEKIFGCLGNVNTWSHRSQVLSPRVCEFYSQILQGVDLVVGFELPESLFDFCQQRNIRVYDFSFHFVRFEADYAMMVRTNVGAAKRLLKKIRHQVGFTDLMSRLRKPVEPIDTEEIRLFVMQTRFDRSKFNGSGAIIDDLELLRASDVEFTHYKAHPLDHRPELELLLTDRGAEPFPSDVDIYAFLARYGHNTHLHTISSGLAAEGDLIGVKSITMIGFPWTIDGYEKYSSSKPFIKETFIPVDNRVFSIDFARALFSDGKWVETNNLPSQFSLKDYWNVKWS